MMFIFSNLIGSPAVENNEDTLSTHFSSVTIMMDILDDLNPIKKVLIVLLGAMDIGTSC